MYQSLHITVYADAVIAISSEDVIDKCLLGEGVSFQEFFVHFDLSLNY